MPVWDAVLALLYPPRCPFCGRPLPCRRGLPEICPSCRGLPFAVPGAAALRFLGPPPAAPFFYEGPVRRALERFKFGGRAYALPFAAYAAPAVERAFPGAAADFVCAVPLTRRERRRRGYNQSALFGRALAKFLGLPYREALIKPRDIPPQRTLRAVQRRENVRGAFRARRPLHGETVLLADDIATTGATLSACAEALRTAGAGRVLCAAVAVAPFRGGKRAPEEGQQKADGKQQ